MLYKNLPPVTMQLTLAARLALNTLAAAVYLARRQPENWSAVWQAHRDFFKLRREVLHTSRRRIQASRIARPRGIWRGSILVAYLFGRRRFSQLKSLQRLQ
jgi:hypothetical protein